MFIIKRKRDLKVINMLFYLAISLSLISLQQFSTQNGNVFFPLYKSVAVITNVTKKPSEFVYFLAEEASNYINAISENKKLKEENERLRTINKKVVFLNTENQELRYLLNMSKLIDQKTISADVYLDSSSLYVHSFIVNRGKKEGITTGSAVLNKEGIIGRILDVGDSFSRVLLINDYNASIPVRVLESGVSGIIKGRNDPYSVKLITKEAHDVVKTGEHVVTSSLQGLFEEGLPVGVVGKVTEDKIEVIPYANLSRINKVLIVERERGDR